MVVLTADVVYNRLQDIKNPTQEAIETMSLWIMHYKDKASIDLIVDGWLNCFKTAGTDSKRIALFYVMNDVVQKAKIKHADTIIPAFQPAVLTAVATGRKQDKVKDVMKRCIQIFKTRGVFSSQSTTAMENLLASDADEGYEAEDQALEVDSEDLLKRISNFVSARNVISDMMKFVNEGDFDYKEKCKSGIKDREEGAHILQEVHEAIDTMVQVRHSMEDQKKKMMALSETLELAKRVFLHQKREVLVVEEAYINFRDGIKAVHSDLVEMEEKGVYPGVLSPQEEDNHLLYSNRQQGGWGDNRNQVDMEMDDDERPQAPMMKPHLQALVGISSQPSLQSRIMQLGLQKIADGDEDMFHQQTMAASSEESMNKASTTFQDRNLSAPSAPININQFSVPPPAIPSNVPDPRLRAGTEGPSQYALALQQHGLPPLAQHTEKKAPPHAVAPAYQPPFDQAQRDPRFPQHNQPPPTQLVQIPQPSAVGYQAQFEQRDPRIAHQTGQQVYPHSFDAQKPPLKSPTVQTGPYQARFESSQISPQVMTQSQMNQYHQQSLAGAYNRPPPPQPHLQQQQQQHQIHQQPQRGYTDYHSGGGDRREDRFNRRDDRGRNKYDDRRNHDYDDRRKSAPYPRGGGDRWKNGGGSYNDRGRNDRDWRGGSRGGGYNNRY
ncbi:hypothetical protein L5515_001656 [Caenorhabditis briggsae]|uniref:CID domain-containing protein n=1 Tax=Caenorhabditis briggsae TaxID=6238 RepID=A0AAE9E5U3_CAEBR|nr:hypothetical protein L5515_001656 [Caenorhabditis briggsae]